MTRRHQMPCRVYYEDTDLGGIVYYANYLKFIERARTEMLREAGLDQTALKAGAGVVFAVRTIAAEYISPARFDDLLTIESEIAGVTGARVQMVQTVRRGEAVLFRAELTLVCIGPSGRPVRLPATLRQSLAPGTG